MKKSTSRRMTVAEQTTRRFDDLRINGGGDGTWTKIEDWFLDEEGEISEDAEFSIPFSLVESFEYSDEEKRPKYGFGLKVENDDTLYYIAVGQTDKSGKPYKERKKLFELLQDDLTPIEGCCLQRIDTGKANPFITFISVEKRERIEASEEAEDD